MLCVNRLRCGVQNEGEVDKTNEVDITHIILLWQRHTVGMQGVGMLFTMGSSFSKRCSTVLQSYTSTTKLLTN